MADYLFEARHIKKYFPVTSGLILRRPIGWIKAVDDVSFGIPPGKTLSLVGESGAGKTTTSRMALLLEIPTAGTLLFDGKEVSSFSRLEMKEYRSSVQAVFQDPWSSMNPRMRVRSILSEPLVVNTALSRRERRTRVVELLEQVGLRSDHAELYPHEFSGGQRQRIAVARSLALHPRLIVLDEPVSALDVSIRAQILNLLKDLQRRYDLGYLLIAHNLATVRYMSHAVAIMYMGEIVEYALEDELFMHPLHPYTCALIDAALPLRFDDGNEQRILNAEMPPGLSPPLGCRFHPRCPMAEAICSQVSPPVTIRNSGHSVRCHLY